MKKKFISLKSNTGSVRNFNIPHAISVLSLKNSQWTVDSEDYEFNGSDIVKKKKEE